MMKMLVLSGVGHCLSKSYKAVASAIEWKTYRLSLDFETECMTDRLISAQLYILTLLQKSTWSCVTTKVLLGRFENTYFLEATEANKLKVFGKDFIGWAKGEGEEESIWEDAEDSPEQRTPNAKELKETFKTPSKIKIQSLTLGALDRSFLVSDSGLDVLSNESSGLEGKGISIRFQDGGRSGGGSAHFSTPKKGMLIRGETNMMLLSPNKDGKSSVGGVSQLDIGTGKMVAEWKFEKDGTPITMRDVTNDSKGSQLYSGGSTFLGLDDNRLCRWDMRDRHGVVQQLGTPVSLNWSEGHQVQHSICCLLIAAILH